MSRPTVRPSRAAAALVVLLSSVALVSTGPAPAGAADPTPTTTDGPHLYASTYLHTGTQQTFTVPEGVSAVQVEAIGAAGGDAGGSHGGRGATVTGTLAVSEGQVLYLWVGGQGGSSALSGARGWNGGGQGAQSNQTGGGGGGATDVRTCPAAVAGCDSISSRVLVAAGGGGAGAADVCAPGASPCPGPRGYAPGGDAGASADSISFGSRGTATGGGAATTTAGGVGGPGTSDTSEYAGYGASGTLTTGGDSIRAGGRTSLRGGGGGGGGVYGGGAGSLVQYYGAGGGGGSSPVPPGGTFAVSERGTTASLRISYDLGPVTEMRVRVAETNTVLVGTGADTRTIIATARTEGGARIPGLDVTFSSTDDGQSFGPVTDNGDGTYSVTVQSSTTVGTATVTATAAGSTPDSDVLGTLDVATEGYTVAVAPVTKTLVATGHDTTTVVATAESTSGKKLDGLSVSFASTDAGQGFGAVTAGAGGTYSATLTGSATAGNATVTPVVSGAGSPTLNGTSVATEAYAVTVEAPSRPLVATGWDAITLTAQVETASGRGLAGLDLSFGSTDAEQVVGPVTDHGDGSYTATVTGSTAVGTATVTAVVTGAGSPPVTAAAVVTEAYTVTVQPITEHLLATGSATRVVVARAESASGQAVRDLEVAFTSTDGGHRFGSVSDRGDGTYSARLTGSTTAGSASISVRVTGAGSPLTVPAAVVFDPYLKPVVTAVLSATSPARNGWYRSPVTVRFTCTGSLPLTPACPVPVVLSADGRGQVVAGSVRDSLGSTASATSAAVNIDATRPSLKVRGAKKGKTYAKAPRLSCRATDRLSGIASCRITTKKATSKKGTLVRWTAVALDRAGNRTSNKGSYTVRKKGARR